MDQGKHVWLIKLTLYGWNVEGNTDTDFGSDISWLFLLLNADEFNQNLWTLRTRMSLK